MSRVTTHVSLEDKYNLSHGDAFVTGVQALVQLLVTQHRQDRSDGASAGALVTGYQGSPLGVLDLELQRHPDVLAENGIVHQPAVNEELAATALLGSQLVGRVATARFDRVVGMWYGKAPGLDRAADAIRHANHIGCPPTGGVLAVVGDDPGAKSSTLPSASETTLAALQLPTLYPADPAEVVELGLHGYTMSRLSGLWVGCKVATSVADGSQSVSLAPPAPHVPVTIDIDGRPYVHTPAATLAGKSTLDLERSLFYARTEIARRYITANNINRIVVGGTADRIGIVSAGKTWLDLRQALLIMGLDDAELARLGIRLIKLGALYPLDREGMRQFTAGLETVIVVEEKGPFIESQVRDLLYADAVRPDVVGKTDGAGHELFAANGELSPDQIADSLIRPLTRHHPIDALARWQEERARHRPPVRLPLMVRTPYFCSGCPHNRSVKVPEGSLVGGGIGCHGMAVLMKPEQVGTLLGLTQMGGEGAQWVGMAPFSVENHIFQNLGDGTFFHSGSLAVRAAVSSGVNITYKILYNSAVAMTGGQDVKGARPIPDLARLLLAEGVGRVIVTSEDPSRLRGASLPRGVEVWHRDRLIEAQEVLAAIPGVTVLVHDQECAAEKRRKRKRGTLADPAQRIFVNQRVCEACGDCGVKSNCLSVQTVETEFGPKTHIHQPSCNKDYTCVDGDCPSFISVLPGTGRSNVGPGRPDPDALGAGDFPAVVVAPSTGWTVRFLGVGGTGVVTASQILGTAALADGLRVRGLDQTGLAQKGGPVVSDLIMGTDPAERGNKLGDGECDLYLGCDLVVAANPIYLAVADPGRTASIVSTARVPTGDMVGDPRAVLPETERFVDAIAERSDAGHSVFVDAHQVCEALFGGTEFVNVFLLGAAFQSGRLPVSAEAIEEAITLNGAAVAKNIQAFRRGRQQVADPNALARASRSVTSPVTSMPSPPAAAIEELCQGAGLPADGPLGELVRHRVADLIAYQSRRYAGEYTAFVGRVHREEQRAVPGGHDELSLAVARYLYKLMAYKDEYEVARLSLDPSVANSIHEEFGPDVRYAVMLHPPVLKALGVKRKIRLERSAGPSFRVLRSMRKLRGTPFDPFGRTRVRKTERSLIAEYRSLVNDALADLGPSTLDTAVALACLPDGVRGYEDIKLRSVEEFRRQATELRGRIAAVSRK
jgi:indolepyruvate ferredoxin oxidoreductase